MKETISEILPCIVVLTRQSVIFYGKNNDKGKENENTGTGLAIDLAARSVCDI